MSVIFLVHYVLVSQMNLIQYSTRTQGSAVESQGMLSLEPLKHYHAHYPHIGKEHPFANEHCSIFLGFQFIMCTKNLKSPP